ncbi:hypothetical protein P175DRAFT_0502028 [Aspergillus ochraceoroseus IBT 24754]|uniref:Aminodeoxychorismate lyase n=3 Tax=Aspergillus subgen. Nidulantes TaxID=2720870 RepID=A0A0F8VMX4_9EURO|nr:uncharacterized protein P175DRAFT_0502028 [Aspergillus ochraceoroseus IBT 24754]KKK18242.1 hypothetical protein AOCH_003726 [Aspergillus ochraceoroseus]KKK24466.1 hypothetical protein ARAM_005530 [Aspergillus rambellii]PTU19854.1 hypothetical protein P175DRAFT_0502028 [Aspergillus ochraceoroseus IBT 24754]
MSSQSFEIISSLRYDPALPPVLAERGVDASHDSLNSPYYLLPYHQDRLRNAAANFDWKDALNFLQQDTEQFSRFLDTFIPDKAKPWRVRIVVDRSGDCKVEVNPAAPIQPQTLFIPFLPRTTSNPWRVYIDTESTTPSAFTTHKTTARDFYTAARLRSGIISPQDDAEVLLVNPRGEIMEGSITTPFFKRRGDNLEHNAAEWITPPLASGGNAGTTRRYALVQGFCTEQTIAATDLVEGEECLLSNGVRGFIYGRIVLKGPHS